MALTGTDRGSGTHNSAATSFTAVPASNLAAGSMAVLVVAADNAHSNGTAFTTFSVTDTKGNTWTLRQDALYDPGAASAGVELGIFTTPQAGGALLTTDTITISFGTDTPTAKAWTLMEVAPAAGSTVSYVTGATGSGAGTGTPSVTTGSIANGDMVIGAVGAENTASSADPWVGDTDTTNGSWSTRQHNGVTASTSGISVTSQRKVVTGAGAQTYNPTASAGTPDCIPAWIELAEVITNPIPTPGVAALTLTLFTPTVTASDNKTATPGVVALTLTLFTPTVTVSVNRTATPGVVALTLTPFTPVVTASDNKTATPGVAALVLTSFVPTVSTPRTATPGVVALVLTPFTPVVTASDHKTATPGVAALILSPLTPVVTASNHKVATPGVATLALVTFAPTATVVAGFTDDPDDDIIILMVMSMMTAEAVRVRTGHGRRRVW